MHDSNYYEYDTFAQDTFFAGGCRFCARVQTALERTNFTMYALQICLGLEDSETCHARFA